MIRFACLTLCFICLILPVKGHAADKFLDIQDIKSPGGISAWLVEDHNLPIIALKFTFRDAGSKQDAPEKQGLSILASNTMDEGAGEHDSEAFQQLLTDNSITLSFSSGRDDFSGTLKTLSRKKDLAFDLLTLALTKPRFDAEPLERMRAANVNRIQRSRGKPDWIAARIMNDIAYQGHPYAQNSGGTLSTLQNITADDLRGFVKTRLGKDNLIVTAVGDITAKELSAVLDKIFGSLPEQTNLEDKPALTLQNTGTVSLYKQDIPQTIIEINQPGIGRDHPDFYAAQVMNFILGSSGFGSRLMDEIREKRGLTYGIYSHFMMMDHIDTLNISTSTKNNAVAEVLNIIKQEQQKMATTPVSDEEINAAKSYLVGSMPLALSSTGKIAGLLMSIRLDGLPVDYLDNRADKINAVTKEDIQRVSKSLLTTDKSVTVLVGQPENITPDKIIETLPNVD